MNNESRTRNPATAQPFDTSGCESEPIHVPGSIQPHGALIAVLASSGLVTHASANLEDYVGIAVGAALGRPVAALFDDGPGRSLLASCQGPATGGETLQACARDGSPLNLHVFRSGDHLCVDIEPVRNVMGPEALIAIAQFVLKPLREVADRAVLCERAVVGLKRIFGYDRVMAYRFGDDGHGEVIAEVVEPGLESYLGLRYPASDIPPQARLLYARNRVGGVVDAGYTPVPVIVAAGSDHASLDLTMSALRSVSPVHREYMRNMGTRASLTIALMDRERLWGMLICHHATPRMVGAGHRAVADIVGQMVSLLLQTLGAGEINTRRLERVVILRALIRNLSVPVPLFDAITAAQSEFLDAVGATGALVIVDGALAVLGQVPPLESSMQALQVLRADAEDGFLAVNDLSLRYPELAACSAAGSGALFIARRIGNGDGILWFRPEIRQTVQWGGDPCGAGRSENGAKISPRKSFEAWTETISGRARPWSEVDLAMAREVGSAIAREIGRRAKAELAKLRHYDPLTGLPNRSLLKERLAAMEQEAGSPIALLFFDLDGFKAVNDTLGHPAGDALLIEVARRVSAAVGPDHFTARLGGDEFVVLGRMDRVEANRVAEAVRLTVAAPFDAGGQTCAVAASIGIAFAGRCGRFDLIRAADMAMYDAKRSGGNRASEFDIAMYDRASEDVELERDLRSAVDDDRGLTLLYQPVYSLGPGDRRLVAFEALVRWNHPRHGCLLPDRVIAVAEKPGVIVPLGRWVLSAAVRAGRRLQQTLHATLSISVNASVRELCDDGFPTRLDALLRTEHYDPATLCLEVTEETLHDPKALAVLEEVQRLGVRIAIDEFGIGYSSLSYLRRLPVDVVKLDGSFLANAGDDTRAAAFLSAVIALAHAAEMAVVVEGVETEVQLALAMNAGADMVQGLALAPPLALEVALKQGAVRTA